MEGAPTLRNKQNERLENIGKELLGERDPREVLLKLFDKLEDDYELVEKKIMMLKGGDLTDEQRSRIREVEDAYPGALDEWVEENTPPVRGR